MHINLIAKYGGVCMEKENIIVNGKTFTKNIIKGINTLIKSNPKINRNQIAAKVCEWLNWKTTNGEKQMSSCNVALRKLNNKGIIKLPEPKRKAPILKVSLPESPIPEPIDMPESAEDIKKLNIYKLTSKDKVDMKIWNWLIQNEHPLGITRLVGRQMRYLIHSEHGYLGAIAFSASAWSLKARDSWIGWDDIARQKGLHLIANMSRFLIRNTVHCKNLASMVLSICTKQLQKDWEIRYGEKLALLETFVDSSVYKGTCYKAANWIKVGKTVGRGRFEKYHRHDKPSKDIYVLPLSSNFRQELGGKEEKIKEREVIEDNWIAEEFSNLQIGDKRLEERAKKIIASRWNNPSAAFPQSFSDKYQLKSAYSFFSNNNGQINTENVLKTHYNNTLERMSSEKVVLAVSDTSILNYDSISASTIGLGPIGSNQGHTSQGLFLHSTLAFNEEGVALGLLGAESWARKDKKKNKKKKHESIPIEEKESFKWIKSYNRANEAACKLKGTLVVNVCDREGDIYDLFELALSPKTKSHLLVRAVHNRRVEHPQYYLLPFMLTVKPLGTLKIEVPRKKGKKKRIAQVEVRSSKVILKPPQRTDGKKHSELSLWCIYISEIGKEDKDKVEWMLLTTVRTENFKEAIKRVSWYCRRWGIEEFHYILKSGCNIEKRQLKTAKALITALSFDMVIAWRILMLLKLTRYVPNIPCTVAFDEYEWKVLFEVYKKKKLKKPPTIREMVREVAKLGGYLGRKGDGEPGVKTLWRGLIRLTDMAKIYRIMIDRDRYP